MYNKVAPTNSILLHMAHQKFYVRTYFRPTAGYMCMPAIGGSRVTEAVRRSEIPGTGWID